MEVTKERIKWHCRVSAIFQSSLFNITEPAQGSIRVPCIHQEHMSDRPF